MSHMKKMLEEHEDGLCDRSTCLKCAEDGPTILTPAQDEDGTQPLIRPDELQAQLQARVNELQEPTKAERDEFEDARARNDAAWELSKDGALEKFACENPQGYEAFMAVLQRHLAEAVNEPDDWPNYEDAARA